MAFPLLVSKNIGLPTNSKNSKDNNSTSVCHLSSEPMQCPVSDSFQFAPPPQATNRRCLRKSHASKSPLKIRVETESPSSSSQSTWLKSSRRPNGPQVENGSIRVLRSIRFVTNRELSASRSGRIGECVVTMY